MRLLLSLMLLILSTSCYAIVYPVMTEVEITSCNPGCAANVYYAGKMELLESGVPVMPRPTNSSSVVQSFGVHCSYGDKSKGIPYSGCSWRRDNGTGDHSPTLYNCNFVKEGEWEVTKTCSAGSTWGFHTGAAPGGECVMFGVSSGVLLHTPFGAIDSTAAANGGNRYCLKPLAPGATCSITLPAVIDHGVLMAGLNDKKYVDGSLDCGDSPVVEIVGGAEIEPAPGVRSTVTATLISNKQLRVQSDMSTVASATPGSYASAVVVSISPY